MSEPRSEIRHVLAAIAGAVALLLLGGALVVWPDWRETRETWREVAELERKVTDLEARAATVEQLADELGEARRKLDADFKIIPDAPNIAGLMQRLSLPVDGRTVLDQTFTAGSPGGAVPGSDFPERATPLTIDMAATFDAIFAVMRAAEAMDRMIRVSSLRVNAERTAADPEVPILSASVGLDVVFDPPAGEEGG